MNTETPRGIRLNNPGNIRHGQPWEGLSSSQSDPDFCQFIDPQHGIRAIAEILRTYAREGTRTLSGVINRWAPSSENDTDAYLGDVSDKSGIEPTVIIDLTNYMIISPLIEAMIWHENGQQPYTQNIIDQGLSMANVEIIS